MGGQMGKDVETVEKELAVVEEEINDGAQALSTAGSTPQSTGGASRIASISTTSTVEEAVTTPAQKTAAKVVTKRDDVRATLAIVALSLFAVTILLTAGIVLWASAGQVSAWMDFVQIVIPVETLLIGGASAFYYNYRP